eukprot:Awhi_evm3s12304
MKVFSVLNFIAASFFVGCIQGRESPHKVAKIECHLCYVLADHAIESIQDSIMHVPGFSEKHVAAEIE